MIACSSDDSKNDGGAKDSGPMAEGGADSGGVDTGIVDTGVGDAGLNGCATFDDQSAPQSTRTITWQFNPTPKCIEIAQGQTVTWQGDFGFHPLEPLGGTTPTPIMSTATGTSAMFTFPDAGFYGFHCGVHSGLEGVVHVR